MLIFFLITFTPEVVQNFLNTSWTYAPDSEVYGQREYWATFRESYSSLKGDCEDYSIFCCGLLDPKYEPKVLKVYIMGRGIGHAVCLFKDGDSLGVIDRYGNPFERFKSPKSWVTKHLYDPDAWEVIDVSNYLR